MKKTTLLIISTLTGLSACSTNAVKMVNAEEAARIKHICIIQNAKNTAPAGYERQLAAALKKRGVSSELVAPQNRARLYEAACKYNLRYKTTGNSSALETANVLIRTPEYEVSGVKFSADSKKNLNLQQQTDEIVAKLLNR